MAPTTSTTKVQRDGTVVAEQVIGRIERVVVPPRIEWKAYDACGRYVTTQGSRRLAVKALASVAR